MSMIGKNIRIFNFNGRVTHKEKNRGEAGGSLTPKVAAAGAPVVFVFLLSIHIPLHHWLDGNVGANFIYNSCVLVAITIIFSICTPIK